MYIPLAYLGILAVPILVICILAWYHESFSKPLDARLSRLQEEISRLRRQVLTLMKESRRGTVIRTAVEGSVDEGAVKDYLDIKQSEFNTFMKKIDVDDSDAAEAFAEEDFPEVERLVSDARARRQKVRAGG